MFEVDEFIASCQAALKEHTPELALDLGLATAVRALPYNRILTTFLASPG